MDELNKLDTNNQKQLKNLQYLWHELSDLRIQYNKRNKVDKKSYEEKLTYSLFLKLIPFLHYKDLVKLRLLSKQMSESMKNYLLYYRKEQKLNLNELNAEIREEIEQLPLIDAQIFKEQALKSHQLRKLVLSQAMHSSQNITIFNDSLIIFQIAQCEGWELPKIQSYHIQNLKNSLIFLDFSKFSEIERRSLLQFYEEKIQGIDQMKAAFLKLARLWLKQTFYENTYQSFSKIMKMIKRSNLIKKEVTLLKNLKNKQKICREGQ